MPMQQQSERKTVGAVERLALGVNEAAEAMGVSPKLVREMLDDGRLRSVRAGRRVLIPADALRDLLAGGR